MRFLCSIIDLSLYSLKYQFYGVREYDHCSAISWLMKNRPGNRGLLCPGIRLRVRDRGEGRPLFTAKAAPCFAAPAHPG
jgi:hypothetical protein